MSRLQGLTPLTGACLHYYNIPNIRKSLNQKIKLHENRSGKVLWILWKETDSWLLVKTLSGDLTLYNFILCKGFFVCLFFKAMGSQSKSPKHVKYIQKSSCSLEGGSFSSQSKHPCQVLCLRARAVTWRHPWRGGFCLQPCSAPAPCWSDRNGQWAGVSILSQAETFFWEIKMKTWVFRHSPPAAHSPIRYPLLFPAATRWFFSLQFLWQTTSSNFISC